MNTEIELRDLRHLVLLAEEMNFSRAAVRAHLSQTAFSRSIQAIEERYGLRLFDRSTRKVRPTAACTQLLGSARQLLACSHDFGQELQYLSGSLGGELRFGTSLLGVDCILQGLLPELRRQSPKVKFEIEVGQWTLLVQHLEAERIEFFVAYPSALAQDPRFVVLDLPAQPASIFCRADHPLTYGTHVLALKDLLAYGWSSVHFAPAIAEQLRRLCGVERMRDLPLDMNCDNKELLREMTLQTDSLLFTWNAWVQKDVDDGRLVDLHDRLRQNVPAAMFQLGCAIVRLADRSPSPLANALIATIQRESRSNV